jgi:hypothetical protein
MKWRHLGDTHDFVLPITARRLAGAILRKAKLGDGSITSFFPRGILLRPTSSWTQHRRAGGEVEDVAPEDWPEDWPEERPGIGDRADYAMAPIVTRSYVRWLSTAPSSLGKVFCSAFRTDDGALVGLTICRIEESRVGCKARLIHLQAFERNLGTLRWMIAENIHRAAQLHAESVHCRSSCAITDAALASLHFRRTANAPVMTGFKDSPIPSGPVNITFLRGDDAMIPSLIAE